MAGDLREEVAGVLLDQAWELGLVVALNEVTIAVDNCVDELPICARFDPAVDAAAVRYVQVLRHLPVLCQLAPAAFVVLHSHDGAVVHDTEGFSEIISLDGL